MYVSRLIVFTVKHAFIKRRPILKMQVEFLKEKLHQIVYCMFLF